MKTPRAVAYQMPSSLGLLLKPKKTEAAQSSVEGPGGGPRVGAASRRASHRDPPEAGPRSARSHGLLPSSALGRWAQGKGTKLNGAAARARP